MYMVATRGAWWHGGMDSATTPGDQKPRVSLRETLGLKRDQSPAVTSRP